MCEYLLLGNSYLKLLLPQLQEKGKLIPEVQLFGKQIKKILFHCFRTPINIVSPFQLDPLFSDNLNKIESFIERTIYHIYFLV
jgi:hypothetical protein